MTPSEQNMAENPPPSLGGTLEVLFKRAKLIVAVLVLAALAAMLYNALATPIYELNAGILVTHARAEVALSAAERSLAVVERVAQEDLNTEIQILGSRELTERVARALEAGSDEGGRSRPPVLGDDLVLLLESDLSYHVARDSNIVRLGFVSSDSAWGKQVLETLLDVYLSHRSELNQQPEALDFFLDQKRQGAARLALAEEALRARLSETGLSLLRLAGDSNPLAAQNELKLKTLVNFEDQLRSAEIRVIESRQTIAALEELLARESARLPSANRTNLAPEAEEMLRQIATLELERDNLLQDYLPESSKVRSLDQQILLARTHLDDASGDLSGTEPNPVHASLRLQLSQARATLQGAVARHDALLNQVAELRAELDVLNSESFAIADLYREMQAAEREYLTFSRKYEESRVSSAMDRSRIVNVSVAWNPSTPINPASPRAAFNLALALFGGLLVGFGLVFVSEFLDHSLSSGDQLERRLGVPLLATIPDWERS